MRGGLNAVAFSWAHRQNRAGSSDAQLCCRLGRLLAQRGGRAGGPVWDAWSAAARGGSTNTAAAAAPATLNMVKRLPISRLPHHRECFDEHPHQLPLSEPSTVLSRADGRRSTPRRAIRRVIPSHALRDLRALRGYFFSNRNPSGGTISDSEWSKPCAGDRLGHDAAAVAHVAAAVHRAVAVEQLAVPAALRDADRDRPAAARA